MRVDSYQYSSSRVWPACPSFDHACIVYTRVFLHPTCRNNKVSKKIKNKKSPPEQPPTAAANTDKKKKKKKDKKSCPSSSSSAGENGTATSANAAAAAAGGAATGAGLKVHIEGMDVTPLKDFASVGMPAEVMEYVTVRKWKEPTQIQAHCWPVLNAGRDVVGIAETGSGKTLAFSLPAMSRIYTRSKKKVRLLYRG